MLINLCCKPFDLHVVVETLGSIVRRRILTEDYRIDGRGLRDIRTLSAEVDIVPRVHGSALFQRGETRASKSPPPLWR